MESSIRFLALALFLSVPICGHSENVDDDLYQNKMIENMKLASLWMIEEGVNVYSKNGKEGLHRKLVDEWGVQIWVDPLVETERYLAQLRIKARGINYDIHNLYREVIDGCYYEFWLIKVAAQPWSGETDRSEFFVTRTTDIYGSRKILEKSDQFSGRFAIDESKEIFLPVDDLQLLYVMQAWLFPDNYRDSNLKNKKVVMDSNGNLSIGR